MHVAKTMHIHRLNTDSGTAVALIRAEGMAGVFLALTPLVKGEVLLTHGGGPRFLQELRDFSRTTRWVRSTSGASGGRLVRDKKRQR